MPLRAPSRLVPGSHIHITAGTGPITDIDWSSAVDGRHCMLIFDVAATMTHGANLVLPGGVSHDFAIDDNAIVLQDSGDKVYVYPLKARKPKFLGHLRWGAGSKRRGVCLPGKRSAVVSGIDARLGDQGQDGGDGTG